MHGYIHALIGLTAREVGRSTLPALAPRSHPTSQPSDDSQVPLLPLIRLLLLLALTVLTEEHHLNPGSARATRCKVSRSYIDMLD